MLSSIVILGLGLLAIVLGQTPTYSSIFDDLDVEAILNDDEVRDSYYNCFMDLAPCPTSAATFFKSKAPEAMITSCKYCTEKQLEMFGKIAGWYVQHKPAEWNTLIEKILDEANKRGLKFL